MTDHLHLRRWCVAFTVLGVLLLLPVFCRGADVQPALRPYVWNVRMTGVSMGAVMDDAKVVPLEYSKLHPGLWVLRAKWNRKGQVVGYVAHRIIASDGPLYVLQGDNRLTNSRADLLPLSPSNYAGVICDPKTLKPL